MLGLGMNSGTVLTITVEGVGPIQVIFSLIRDGRAQIVVDAPKEVRIGRGNSGSVTPSPDRIARATHHQHINHLRGLDLRPMVDRPRRKERNS